METLQALILALIQGLTEFLPISSSAHLILPARLLGWKDQGLAFDVVVHLGTLVAVMLYFRHELKDILLGARQGLRERHLNPSLRLGLLVVLATVPAVVAGFLGRHWIETLFREETAIIASTTVIFGLLLGFAEKTGSRQRTVTDLGVIAALVIGCFQVLALIPGTSRSGITITAALLLGFTRTEAARFSFLMSIPVIAGACLLMLLELLGEEATVPWGQLGIAFFAASVVAYYTIHFFLRLLDRLGMMPFVVYRLMLGLLLFLFFV